MSITAIDAHSVHRITSGQVVVDLQSAVKELVENSLDAGATSIEVRFQNHGLKSIEIVDNGSGIAPKDYDSIALKHYTSKLASFEDLSRVLTFGFRGEALSSLCALTDGFTVTTATSSESPMGTVIEMDRNGKVRSKGKIARQRGTTVMVSNLFKPLPVRRKELERNTKREFQKALNLLHAYALVPCALENKGVRLTVSNQTEGGQVRKVVQFKTDGSPSIRTSVLAVWGSKALENIVDLDLSFDVETEKSVLRRVDPDNDISVVTPVKVQGLISKFAVGAGRTSVDRQFFFVNGRPFNPGKVQKAINEVYRTFNINQSPFVIANVILPTNACDINVSPDKRTIFLHSENNLVQALKAALETVFSSARSTYDVTVQPSQTQLAQSSTQPSKGREGARERGEKRSQPGPSSSAPDDPAERGRTSPPPLQSGDTNSTCGGDEPITTGVPHLLLAGGVRADRRSASDSEPEPEPTLVAQPKPSGKGSGSGAQDGTVKSKGGMIDRPRSRAPSEPLFFPESDEEQGNGTAARVVKGKEKEGAGSGQNRESETRPSSLAAVRSAPIAASSSSATPSTSTAARSSTHVHDKPRSVQTVLSTRGAAWNLRRDEDGDEGGGRERKRARLSNEGDRVQVKRKSFRSSLSQFLSTGKKALLDEEEEESGSESKSDGDRDRGVRKGGDSSEVDELDTEDEDEEKRLEKGRKKRPRAGSNSSQVTIVVPSDDEHAMDVDEPSSSVTKPSRPAPSAPQTSTGDVPGPSDDVEILSEDEWAFSSTLVGTYVPPPGKTTELPSTARPTRPLAETDTDLVTLRVNLVSIGSHYLDMYKHLSASSESPAESTPSSSLRSAVSSANLDTGADDTVASAALSRIISKVDFEHMVIVGQFNLGFIIVRKRRDATQEGGGGTMDDLFIVDQHAADEKWNFETLQETTVIASQKLFRPQQLQFTAADEMLAVENMDVLKRNGFELEQVEAREALGHEGEDEEGSGVRMRLQLVAQPMSKDTVFDIKDLEELIHLMQDRPRGTMVRCSKARAMFAMRACRRSVMVGKALDKTRMTAIVRHMGTMEQPWNCPHGRPTMRHLSDLTAFGRYKPPGRGVDWEAYGVLGSGSGMADE